MSFGLTQSLWARVLIDSLQRAGVSTLVASPGSRSTPIVQAAADAKMTIHAVIDERSAGFFALGMARATGQPTALVCTSGTAAAHYVPAVLEAHHASIPLVVITADRPPELRDCAAPQAMNQIELYGGAARLFIDLGIASEDPRAVRGLRRRIAQAVSTSQAPHPGPVHINAAFRKPLERVVPSTDDERERVRAIEKIQAEALPMVAPATAHPDEHALQELCRACADAKRGVIIAGPATRQVDSAYALASATGFPVLCEAASQLRFLGSALPAGACDGFDLLYRSPSFAAAHQPDLIIQLGPPPISTAWNRLVAGAPHIARYVIAEHGWPDPMSTARVIIRGNIETTIARLVDVLEPPDATPWSDSLTHASRQAWQVVEAELSSNRDATMSEAQAMRAVVAAIPSDSVLVLGNSLPVRTVDAFCPGTLRGARVLTQRGVNGIDGVVSGSAGTASAIDRPVVAILGDVTFTHDVGGLAAARLNESPLVLVIIDNAGGRIFDHLPIADATHTGNTFEQCWTTPPRCDFAAAAAMFGHPYFDAATPTELASAITTAVNTPGCSIIRAPVTPQSAAASLKRIGAAIDASYAEPTS